jgi:small subunit ribosomal protein S21
MPPLSSEKASSDQADIKPGLSQQADCAPACRRRTSAADLEGASMPLRMRVHDREPIGAALRRFKKLLERSGVTKELRKRKYYEKPCEARRRAKLRKLSAIRKGKLRAPGK